MDTPIHARSFAPLLVLAACAAPAASSPEPIIPATPETKIDLERLGDPEAYDIAEKVAFLSGYDQFDEVAQLNFRFVYLDGEERLFEADHHWDLENQRDRIVWTDAAGHELDAVVDLKERAVYGFMDGVEATGDNLDELWRRAMARFFNDTAWFLLPLKLFDPGARLTHEGRAEYAGRQYEVIRLAFEGGFSGRKYRLFVDPDSFRIHRWEMTKRGQSNASVGMSWETYRPVGPLLLAHEHRMDNSGHRVSFEDTVALHRVRHEELLPEAAR